MIFYHCVFKYVSLPLYVYICMEHMSFACVYICNECISLPLYICKSAKHMSFYSLCTYVGNEYISGCLKVRMYAYLSVTAGLCVCTCTVTCMYPITVCSNSSAYVQGSLN